MEEDATQPATQIVIDPRRLGQASSGLNEEDLADICCILHPASTPSYKAAQLIYETKPECTIATDRNVRIREKYNGAHQDLDTFQLAEQGIESHDLALRLSANLKDPAGGFYFGRNAQRCDFLIGHQDPSRRISNVHFKIYINEYGVLMLEDQSTNGTAVDGCLLRGKEKENNTDYRHTLENGSVIVLTMTPPEEDWKFHVRIPHRELDADNDAYQKNLTAFFLRKNKVKQEHEVRIANTKGLSKRAPLNLFPDVADTPGTPAGANLSSVGRHVKEWRGGNKYNKIGCIGKGAFAVVHKITAKFDGVPYAAKELEKRRFMKNGILDQKVDMEMKIMRKIQHPNVVRYIEHVDWEEFLYIIMEFVPGGDLGTIINQEKYLPETDVKIMAGQLLSALKYLHSLKITHRDVKPDNILISSRQPLHVKLTDFGLSKMIDSEETFLRTFCGTLLYCAPEVYSEYREYDEATGQRNRRDKRSLPKQRYGHAVDIWSLAGVLFYALCGSPPYPVQNGTSYQELLNRIMTQPLDLRPLQRVEVSENGIRFVRSMLNIHPEYRATIEDLERASWFTGIDSQEFSLEEDDVDLIDDGFTDPVLEKQTSQLSINPEDNELNSSKEIENNISDLTEVLPMEIPGSFETSDGNISIDESYSFMKKTLHPGNGRLFGEVNGSGLGSSGVIPGSQLNLPIPSREHCSVISSHSRSDFEPERSRDENSFSDHHFTNDFTPTILVPHNRSIMRHPELDAHAVKSSSLMGAESMVGHLNMDSPSSPTSPVISSAVKGPVLPGVSHDISTSLRRPREEDTDEHGMWRPADLPAKRQRKSEREIDIPVPVSIFWDPKDKSTHHTNYPRMSTSQFQTYQDYALSKGERFVHGQRTFEMTMQSFRSSRSPSMSTMDLAQAFSEPITGNDRHTIMKRDERKLEEVANGPQHIIQHSDYATLDRFLPSTARPSNAAPSFDSDSTPTSATLQPVVGNDFQPPKRILAKFIATPDSCLPTVTLNITESLTSWGRGHLTTMRYSNGKETRIPKYAFKALLFKPGFNYTNPSLKTTQVWQESDQDMRFFISTKATAGIWINGFNLESYERQNPSTRSKYWAELKHGDLVDIWRNDLNPQIFTRFQFECYWGQSKVCRATDENIQLVTEEGVLNDLENVCLSQEKAILAENEQRQKDERDAVRLEQGRENSAS